MTSIHLCLITRLQSVCHVHTLVFNHEAAERVTSIHLCLITRLWNGIIMCTVINPHKEVIMCTVINPHKEVIICTVINPHKEVVVCACVEVFRFLWGGCVCTYNLFSTVSFVMFSQGVMLCESYHYYLFCNNKYNAVVLPGVKEGAVG